MLPWAVQHGIAHRSLAELAKPTGLTRGAFCHYFSSDGGGGLKVDIATQLCLYARELRRSSLIIPLQMFKGGVLSRRQLFAEQMAAYLERSYKGIKTDAWYCPSYQLERELRSLVQLPYDEEYHTLLDDLWEGVHQYHLFQSESIHLETFISGPFLPTKSAVLHFFKSKE